MDTLKARLEAAFPTILNHWKWLHAHPELSGQEKNTATYVADQLRKLGLEPTEHVGGYGVTAVIEGNGPGRCIGLRADMDALPIQEETGVPFASTNPGVMHACGHDAHTAMLLGAAQVLTELRHTFHGKVKLIFQPSEETADNSGAKRMIADGALENPHVDAIIGQHVTVNQTGRVTVRDGAASAASDRFFITVRGKSCHAAKPQEGVDAVVVGAQIITALQAIVSRNISPMDNCVITIGKVNAGTRYNVVADECTMEGTCRNLNPAVRDAMPDRMEGIIAGIANGMGADYEFRYVRGYSPIINDPDMVRLVRRTATQIRGEENVGIPALAMGGEDFSFFAEKMPAVFYRIGCHRDGTPKWPAHNGHFLPDEPALFHGAHVMVASALEYLAEC